MSTRSIYIVDDDEAVRSSLYSLLSALPDQLVRSFASGEAFLERVEELDPGVVLLDQSMPGLSGMEVLQRLDASRFVAIVLTGHGSVSIALEAIRSGAADFLEKPYDPDILLQILDRAFATLELDRASLAKVAAAQAKIDRLSAREREVLKGLIEGRANKVIAHALEISPRTVEIYRSNVMDKLEVRSLSEALRISFAAGLFPGD
ncbi:response regulator transcription factor [Sphingosinicella terrae]|uniref:response regulator transcription factor n=1 Tax=Sphingosinicella terrae TaxID=2172047 RepID=UPI000E0D12C4|nr:response regulator [Sphingosinicella terrae]